MTRSLRVVCVLVGSVVSAVLIWLPLEIRFGFDRQTAQFFAALAAGAVLSVGLTWALRTPLQSDTHVLPYRSPAARIVVGNIPREAAALQPRVELIDELSRLGAAERRAVIGTVTGSRGVGKTQLAATYAHTAINRDWPVVVWLDAQTEDLIISGLVELARRVREAAGDSAREVPSVGSDPDRARAALAWLTTHAGPGLLVYDNAEDPDMIKRWVPAVGKLQVVITTTRRGVFDELGQPVEVGIFSDAMAIDFLRQRTGLADPDGAVRLATELGHLPLALAQAAAVIGHGRAYRSYQSFLSQLASTTLGAQLKHVPGGYPHGFVQALQVSLNHLVDDDDDGHATRILNLLAVLDPVGVEIDLLENPRQWRERQAESGQRPSPDQSYRQIDQAISLLVGRALASTDISGETATIHRLTQRVIRERLSSLGQLDQIRQQAATVIETAIPDDPQSRSAWPACAKLLPHALAVLDLVGKPMWRLAQYPGAAGDYATARGVWQQMVNAYTEKLGPRHPDTLAACAYLADWTGKTGDAVAARDTYATLLPIREQVKGPQHPDTLTTRASLAEWTGWAGDPAAARDKYAMLLPIREQVQGPRHPDTLTTRASLAEWTGRAGDPVAARDQLAALLPVRQEVLGGQHRDTRMTTRDLAWWTGQAGDPVSARNLYAQLLPLEEKASGPEHPDTLAVRANLAEWTGNAGDPAAARDRLTSLLPSLQAVLGPQHPFTIALRNNLANWTGHAGDPVTARNQLAAVVPEMEKVLGAPHPDTLEVRVNLAEWTGRAGNPATARDLYAAVLPMQERVLGSSHPDVESARRRLAHWTELVPR